MQEGAEQHQEEPNEARSAAAQKLREWFEPEEGAGRRLKRRNSGEEQPERLKTPWDPEASSWLHAALGDALGAFGKHVESKLHHVATHVQNIDARLTETEDMVGHLARDTADLADKLTAADSKQEKRIEVLEKGFDKLGQGYTESEPIVYECAQTTRATDKKVEELEKKMASMEKHIAKSNEAATKQEGSAWSKYKPAVAAAPPQRAPWDPAAFDPWAGGPPGMPPPQRGAAKEECNVSHGSTHRHPQPQTFMGPMKSAADLEIENNPDRWRHARLGNVGWDMPSDVLLNRATDILRDLGVVDTVVSMAASVSKAGVGSSVEILFDSPSSLQAAKFKLKTKVTQVEERRVWLDIKKSRSELRPARLIHRAAELLQQFEAERVDAKPIDKNAGAKHIDIGGNRAFFSLRSELKATAWAQQRYAEAQLTALREYAEAD